MEKDPRDIADELSSNIDYMRTLLDASRDKVYFYLENRKLLGPCMELLHACALELDTLLFLSERFLDQMEEAAEAVTDCIYRLEPPRA